MKQITRYICLTIAAAMTVVVNSCTYDSEEQQQPASTTARVTLRIATGNENAATRAWVDSNAKTDRSEMMYNWIVLITNGSTIKYKYSGTPAEAMAEVDDVCTNVEMAAGTYNVYSFANISEVSLKTLLGVSSLEANTALTDATVTAATITINGNGFDTSATDNGFGSQGIPMSGKQTLTLPASGTIEKDLIVVRLLAKIKLSVKNETGEAVTIKYATISNVTDNVANNLMLLPNWTSTTGADNMDVVQHGDLQPNLNGTPTTTELTIPDMATATELDKNTTREVTFYINECKKPTDFYLTIGLGDATGTSEYRYALIDQKGATTTDDDKWDYIARNDYRIIPITLDDYHFELIPYDFPPIGVYPVSTREIDTENHIFEFTFHDYGHFHLLPRVTKGSGATATTVPFGSTEGSDYWTLSTDWAGTWFTAATKGGTWLTAEQITANGFYRDQTATADGDEVGGVPYWYLNDGTAGPQWDPAGGSNYAPFIFGYIDEPDATWWDTPAADRANRQIYHEMKIKLYVNGTYRRDMLYCFYMTLSKDQMLGARHHAAARRPHSR